MLSRFWACGARTPVRARVRACTSARSFTPIFGRLQGPMLASGRTSYSAFTPWRTSHAVPSAARRFAPLAENAAMEDIDQSSEHMVSFRLPRSSPTG